MSILTFSQGINDSTEKKYLEEDRNKISFVGGVSYVNRSFGLFYEGQTFLLKPNDSFYTEFFLRYRWLDASVSFAPKFVRINNDDDIKGKTKYFNLGFAFFLSPKIRQSVNYNQVRGLYLEDTKRFFETVLDDESTQELGNDFMQFPDAKYQSFTGETSYLWIGKKESYRTYTNMTHKPLKNDFILLSGLVYQYNMMKDPERIIYQGMDVSDPSGDISVTKDIRLTIKTGGGMQKIIGKNWYAIVEAYPQIHYGYLIDENYNEFNFGLNAYSRLGFDNGKWFFGGGAQINWINSNNGNFYSATDWLFRFGLGFRINSPKFVNKQFDKIDQILK
ncbi:DUF4421 domain-containing protein [Chryseobacterium chendengshani]|uniref:DUF4421 family protein n=1 Tax=Chryseobacterium sp. LJ668 TaxID=2864040 RepID=UPI001C68AB6E|nr:DUF4421 family protein [Chryseobacterium sp. LJ668]MBW8522955.1 DUF4421 domain-containing protein [Chryseobacterium sp. LJ668]QYK16484.1 DUF4421 domain-containing protein [Chryseobacterium sp. LJ668]